MTLAPAAPAPLAPITTTSPAEPLWQLRINPLRRARLADPTLRVLLADLTDVDRALSDSAAHCADDLYRLIGASSDEAERKRLVEARRAISRDREPRTDLTHLPAVAAWVAARHRRDELRARLVAEHPAAAERERGTLAGLLGDEDLRRSLALLAPEVHEEAERYRAAVATGQPVAARARKSERGLIQYVTRAMVRTSPLARFTAVGIAVPGPDGIDPRGVPFTGAHSFPSLDRVMIAYVLGGLNPPAGAERLGVWVGLSPTSAVEPEQGALFFLRPTEGGYQRLSAPLRGPIKLLMDAIAMGPRPARAVAAYVSTHAGCPLPDAEQIVLRALDSGILCTFNEAENGDADLAEQLDRPDTVAADALTDVRAGLSRLADGPVLERGADLATLRADLARVSRLAQRPAQVMVEEDYLLPPATVDTQPVRGNLADLGAAVELLSVFDWLHDVRMMTTRAFVGRFGAGAGVPLADHADELVEAVSAQAVAAGEYAATLTDDSPVGDDPLLRLYALRRRIMAFSQAEITRAAEAGEPEVRWSADQAYELVADLPEEFRRDPLSYGVLAQWAGDRLVVNDGLPGHGMLYSRFLDGDRRLGGRALPYLADRLAERFGWDGARVVEDLGLHRLNVNAHPRVLPDGLGPDDWYALRLVHDPDTDTLAVTDADGQRLRVLPLGTGHPGLFPPPLSVASCLATGGRLNNYLLDLWHGGNPWDRARTRIAPRIAVGDVVVSRRRWYGGAELDGALATPEGPERLLALTGWRGRYGVPEEVVVKTAFDDEAPRSLRPADIMPRRQKQKPQYVDLTSALGTRVLPRMLERRADGKAVDYLEEALPGVVDGTHAHEWVVEIGRRPGGLFQYGGKKS
ncbi:hypothetical protein [Micromonospora sp. DT231]|uniref:hypothetical protein n=1 Tax=Micromonospora sp. DT231 TaxID=3416526 RepID=UPI003CFB5C8B